MVRKGFVIACLLAVAASAPPRAQDGAFVCGTDESLPQPLAKTGAADAVSGPLKILVLRVAFKDNSYTTDTAAMNATDERVVQFYKDNSHGTVSLLFRHFPSVIKAPDNGQVYADRWDSFTDFIWSKLRELGLSKGKDYDRFIVNFPSLKLGWVGLSSGPASGANYINGNYNSAVVAHELGHAVGLPHAAAMEAGKKTVGTGNDSERVEYGDPFDVMGHGGVLGHFNTWFKRRLGWISSSEYKEVAASGIFRIYAHDNPVKTGHLLALHVPAGNDLYSYWIEYRTSYSSTYVNTRNSVGVRMQDYFGGGKSAVLDMTPGSRIPDYDFNDADLEVGKEFQDPFGNFMLRTVAVNEGMWDQNGWVDVQVTWMGGHSIVPILPSASRLPRFLTDRALPVFAVDANGKRIVPGAAAAQGVFFRYPPVFPLPAFPR